MRAVNIDSVPEYAGFAVGYVFIVGKIGVEALFTHNLSSFNTLSAIKQGLSLDTTFFPFADHAETDIFSAMACFNVSIIPLGHCAEMCGGCQFSLFRA